MITVPISTGKVRVPDSSAFQRSQSVLVRVSTFYMTDASQNEATELRSRHCDLAFSLWESKDTLCDRCCLFQVPRVHASRLSQAVSQSVHLSRT